MNYLSVCSGIEACTMAWHDLGWEPVAFCEFDRFPSQALAHHYPDVPNLGDVTQITDEQIKSLGRIDVVAGAWQITKSGDRWRQTTKDGAPVFDKIPARELTKLRGGGD